MLETRSFVLKCLHIQKTLINKSEQIQIQIQIQMTNLLLKLCRSFYIWASKQIAVIGVAWLLIGKSSSSYPGPGFKPCYFLFKKLGCHFLGSEAMCNAQSNI